MSHTRLHLFKENFKFSAAHFLIFDAHRAERLHGHNYRVAVELEAGQDLGSQGFLIDFQVLKKEIRSHLEKWDEMVLLPEKHPDMRIQRVDSSLDVRFRDRHYVFPANEVVLLPILNTSVELLSQILAQSLLQRLRVLGVQAIEVKVEETPGQAASTLLR